jgi:hypothetical protein
MDLATLARILNREKRNPTLHECIDLFFGRELERAMDEGFVAQKDVEDRVLDFLGHYGFQVAAIRKGEIGFRKTMQFALIALSGRGRHENVKPPVPYLRASGNGPAGRIYQVTDHLRAIYRPGEQGGVDRSALDHRLFVEEGPTGEKKAHNFYLRESSWRLYLRFRHEHPVCWSCGVDMRERYKDDGWAAMDAHHLDWLSARDEPTPTRPDRVVPVCCCCHAFHHRTGTALESFADAQNRVAAGRGP